MVPKISAILFSIIVLLQFPSSNFAQTKGIFIVDSIYKTPVVSAIAEATNFYKISDDNGFINLSSVASGTKQILISSIGYQSRFISIDNTFPNEKNNIVYLSQKITSLSEITIKANSSSGVFKTISDLDIHLRPINNSQEVLRMVPGLFIGQHAGGGKAEQIFLRGFDLDHGTDINITVDGMPVNMVSHAHGQGYADLHFVIPEIIEKVNFNKGPYFADYGNFTTAGYVSFATKDFLENNFIKAEAGQFNTYRSILGVNLLKPQQLKRDRSMYVAGEASYTNGYFESPQNFSRYNALIKYHNNINNRNTLNLSASAFKSKWYASGQIPDRAVVSGQIGYFGAIDDNEGGSTSRYNVNMELLTRVNNNSSFKNQLYFTKYLFELYSNFTFFKEDPLNGDQIRQKENRAITGYNGFYKREGHISGLPSELKTGMQVRYDFIKNIELTRTKERTTNTASIALGDVEELNVAAYISDKLNISKKIELTSGVRADYFVNKYTDKINVSKNERTSMLISPKLNISYKLNNKIQFYLFNGRGFHSNDTRILSNNNNRKSLPPAYGTDLGGIFKLGKKLYLQSAIWHLWLDQEFVYVGDEGIVEAGGKSRRIGVDLSARYQLSDFLYADADISLSHPKAIGAEKGKDYLPLAPVFTSVGGFTYRKQQGINGSLRYRYMADRPANETNTIIAKGYFVCDAAINYTFKKIELGLSVQNIFNTRWKETQFDTESRLQNEANAVSEIHFTPGTPFFARTSFILWF